MRRRFLTILISTFIAGGMALLPSTASAQETKEKQPKEAAAKLVDKLRFEARVI